MPARPKYVTPGPGAYDVNSASKVKYEAPRVSSFSNSMCQYNREKTGPLATSTRLATPSPDQYGIQAANQALKVKVQPGNTKFGSEERKGPIQYLNKGPGPGQYGAGNYDKLASTTRRSEAPKFSFGGNGIREKGNPRTSSTPDSVGPNSYTQGTGIGKQTLSRRPTSPTWGLGSASRNQVQKVCSPGYSPVGVDNNPGPGNYRIGQSVGKQIMSTRSSSPSYGQGTSQRPNLNPKSISPGPGLYRVPSAIKNQVESKRSTTPAWGFGTSQRPSLDAGLVG